MGVGAFIGGRLGDLWGRKAVLIVATVLFGATTALSATSPGFPAWTAWRWIACLGIGAVIPTANALLADPTPSSRRVAFLSMAYAGVGLGATVGAFLAGLPSKGARHGHRPDRTRCAPRVGGRWCARRPAHRGRPRARRLHPRAPHPDHGDARHVARSLGRRQEARHRRPRGSPGGGAGGGHCGQGPAH